MQPFDDPLHESAQKCAVCGADTLLIVCGQPLCIPCDAKRDADQKARTESMAAEQLKPTSRSAKGSYV